jgi:hypothetical protein
MSPFFHRISRTDIDVIVVNEEVKAYVAAILPQLRADLAAAQEKAPDARATLEVSRLEGYASMLEKGTTFSAFLGHFDRAVWEKLFTAYPMEEEAFNE